MAMEKRLLRQWMIEALADMVVGEVSSGRPRSRRSVGGETVRTSHNLSCDPIEPKECSSESRFACPNGDGTTFKCIELADEALQFDCPEDTAFDCSPAETFGCTGKYVCQSSSAFTCDTDIFRCDSTNIPPPARFECQHDGNDFDCVDGGSYDFICDSQGGGTIGTQGFDCPNGEGVDERFGCDRQHVFRCESHFTCPEFHGCTPPKTACPTEDWAPPPDERDDGDAGDFDCRDFTCGASSPGNPQEKFDCGLPEGEGGPSSDFKCLDQMGGSFDCGALSEFECGEEGERYVCMHYECEENFRCETQFHCGNKDEQELTYECRPQFQCAEAHINGNGDNYTCDEGEGSFICEKYNCDVEGYDCNPRDQFKCAQVFSP